MKALAIVSVVLTVAATAGAENLIQNGGFENWTGGVPDEWTIGGGPADPNGLVAQETTDVYEGGSSIELLWGVFDGNWDANLQTRSNMFTLEAGKTYVLSAACKSLPHPVEDPHWNHISVHLGYTFEDGSFRAWGPVLTWSRDETEWTAKEVSFEAEITLARVYVSSEWISHWLVDAVSVVPSPIPQDCNEVWSMGYGIDADLNHDCHVNWQDFTIFAANWLRCNNPGEAGCEETW